LERGTEGDRISLATMPEESIICEKRRKWKGDENEAKRSESEKSVITGIELELSGKNRKVYFWW